METSILTAIKKTLGIEPSYTAFDEDVLMHVNSVFSTLTQLGIGPTNGFEITDDSATWDQLLGTDLRLNAVKSYVYLRVRLLFDPPTTSYLIESMNTQRQELEWRLNAYREETGWTDPTL